MTAYKPNWRLRTYSQEEFVDAWKSSVSIAECARKLGLTVYGTTYRTLKSTAESLGLDSTHMLGQAANRGRTHRGGSSSKPVEDFLVYGSNISSSYLGTRLVKAGLLKKECSAPFCVNPATSVDGWTGQKIPTPVSLDHINGVNNDNRLENLRFVCATCDRTSPTFCRGSGTRKSKITYLDRVQKAICSCGAEKTLQAKMCRNCSNKTRKGFIGTQRTTEDTPLLVDRCSCGKEKRTSSKKCLSCEYALRKGRLKPHTSKIKWPSDEELIKMLAGTNFLQLGKTLGVSDNAVRKHMRRRGLIA